MKMSRLVTAVAAMAVLGLASAGRAAINGSNHDFTGPGSFDVPGVTDTCSPCHVPHKPKQNVPLWGHTLTGASYNLYNTNASYSSGNGAYYNSSPESFTGSNTRACLSCHDGTVAVERNGVFLTSALNPGGWILWNNGAATAAGNASGLLGSHPIGVNYTTLQAAKPTEFAAAPPAAIKLEGGNMVQCTSCHNAHNVNPKMLVMANTNSALCLGCHTK